MATASVTPSRTGGRKSRRRRRNPGGTFAENPGLVPRRVEEPTGISVGRRMGALSGVPEVISKKIDGHTPAEHLDIALKNMNPADVCLKLRTELLARSDQVSKLSGGWSTAFESFDRAAGYVGTAARLLL